MGSGFDLAGIAVGRVTDQARRKKCPNFYGEAYSALRNECRARLFPMYIDPPCAGCVNRSTAVCWSCTL